MINDDTVRAFVNDNFGGPQGALEAIAKIAKIYEIFIAHLTPDYIQHIVEAERGTRLTSQEWARVVENADFTEDYDEFVGGCQNGDDGYVDLSFIRQALNDAGVPGPDGEKWSKA